MRSHATVHTSCGDSPCFPRTITTNAFEYGKVIKHAQRGHLGVEPEFLRQVTEQSAHLILGPQHVEMVKKDLTGFDKALGRISHTFVGRNEQTLTLSELRSQRYGHFCEHGINRENCVCAVPVRLCDLVPAYGENAG